MRGSRVRAAQTVLTRGTATTATLIGTLLSATAQDAGLAPVIGNVMLPRDLSPWGMFMNADAVVKAVLIGLAVASLVTWTVWLAKTIEIVLAKRRVQAALNVLAKARSVAEGVEQLANGKGEVAQLLQAAVAELKLSAGTSEHAGIKERVASRLERIEARYGRRILRGTGVLATIGATAPFVGLFGTVWGIMNSFIGISKSQTTNLAVVAPGIAEALLAHRLRARRRDSGGRDLQRVRALDRRLPRAAWRCRGGGAAPREPRPRPPRGRARTAGPPGDAAVGRRMTATMHTRAGFALVGMEKASTP
jgi:tonB-system energizer ExbB